MPHLGCGGHGLEDGMMEVGRRKPANNGAYTGGKCGGRCLGPKWACGGRIRIVTTKRDKLQSVPMTRCRQHPHLFSQITHKDKPLVVKNPLRKAVFFTLFSFFVTFCFCFIHLGTAGISGLEMVNWVQGISCWLV